MCLDAEVNPNRLRIERKAVPEGNYPFLCANNGSGVVTMEEVCQIFPKELDKYFDRKTSHFERRFEEREKEKKNTQCLEGLQHQAQQPRPAAEVGVKPKTREHTEGVAVDGEKYGDTFSASVENGPSEAAKVLKCQSRIFHPWRCACYYPLPMAYCSPAQSLHR